MKEKKSRPWFFIIVTALMAIDLGAITWMIFSPSWQNRPDRDGLCVLLGLILYVLGVGFTAGLCCLLAEKRKRIHKEADES